MPNFAQISIDYANLKLAFDDKVWDKAAFHLGSIFDTVFNIDPPTLLLSPEPEEIKEPETLLGVTPTRENIFTRSIQVLFQFFFHSGSVQDENNINWCSDSLINMNNKWTEIGDKL